MTKEEEKIREKIKNFSEKGSHLRWWIDPRESWFPLTFLITTVLFWLISQNIHQAVAVSLTLIVFCFNLFSYGYWYVTQEIIPISHWRKIKNILIPFIMVILFLMLSVSKTGIGQVKIFFYFLGIIPIGIVPLFIFWAGTGYWGLKTTIILQMIVLALTIAWNPIAIEEKIILLEQGIIGNENMSLGLGNLLLKLNASLLAWIYSICKMMLKHKLFLWIGIAFVIFNRTVYKFSREMDSFSWEPDE